MVRPAKHARHANDHACDGRCEAGETPKRHFFLSSSRPHLSPRATLERACTPLTKSEEKETAHSLSLQITDEQILVLTDTLVVEMIKLGHERSH